MAQLLSSSLIGKTAINVLEVSPGGTPNFIKIKTAIPFSYGAGGWTVNIKGFVYGSADTIDYQVCWHTDGSSSQFYSPAVTSKGSFAPAIRLARENGNVVICLTWGNYWPKLYVESVYNYSSQSYYSGWTWADEDVTGDKVITLSPKSNFGTNAYATNFYQSGNLVATQSWVTSQGYASGGPFLPLSGGTVSGAVTFNSNINANGTYFNVGGYIDLSGVLYLRSNVNYLNAAGNAWNTFLARNGEGFDVYISRVFSTSHISTTGGNLHTNRGRVAFSSTAGDANHTIYNNYTNIDGEGSWDGMKMNVYNGLDVRTGNASGATPHTVLKVREEGLTITGNLAWNNAAPMLNIGGTGDGRMQVRHIWGKEAGTANPDHLWLQYTNSTFGVQIGASGGSNPLYVAGDIYMGGYFGGNLVATRTWVQSQGYITGSYLPLSGGTMTGNVQFNANLLQFNNSGVRSWNMGISGGNLNVYSGDGSGSLLYNGRPLRDSYYRTYSGYSDYYTGGTAGWYRVAEITLTSNCGGAVIFGTLYDNRYDGADAYQISVVARSECDFSSNNESHYINVGCTILGSTNYTNYRDKIRVVLSASSTNSRTYELQFYETPWNHDTWQIESTGWTVYTSPQAPRAAVGTPRVNYISKQNADNLLANTAVYSPVYYDIANSSYYLDLNSTTSLRTVGSWRSDSGAWDGEFSGKIQYHSNHWYFQAADLWLFRNAGGSNVFSVNQSGSGTFSGTVSASNISTGVTASHIVQRDANGYIYANHINFNTPESENPTISSFFTSNGDGWSRKSSIAHVRNQLGNYGNWITASSLSSYLPLSGGTMTGNLYIQSGANPTQFNLRGTNPELYVDAAYGGGTARLFINRASASHQATLLFTTGYSVSNGTAWNSTGTPLWTMGMTNSSQTSDFKIAYGDIYDAASVAIRIDTSKNVYFTNTPYVGANLIATQSWVQSQGYLTSATVTINSGNGSTSWYPIVWHSGNTLYSSSGTAEIYPAGGYIRVNYFNSSDNDETGITRFVIKNGDNYHRSATTITAADIIRGVASGTWSISINGNANTASNLYGGAGSYIKSSATGTSYQYNIQVRENDGGYASTNEIYAPQLAFHWSGVVASSIMMESSGRIAIRNNPGNAYENFIANIVYGSSDMRAPIYYDSADTTYYGDFAGTSYLRHLSVGDVNASNDGGWNARLNLTGSSHARLDVKSNSDGIITTIYSHTGQGVGRVGTWSNHPLAFMVNGGIAGYAYANYLQGVDSVRAPIFYDSNDTNYYVDPNSNSYLSRLHIADASSGVSMHVGVGSTHGVYTLDNARKYLVVSGDYYPHMALVARYANNTNHGAVFSFVGSEGGAFRQWNLGISNNNPFLFSIGYNRTTDPNPHYGIGDGWSGSDFDHARLSIDRDGNTKIRGMLYVNGTSGSISTGSPVLHSGNFTTWAQTKVYQGQSDGNWQNFTNDVGEFRVDEVLNITSGNHSNHPTGVYTYGGVMSWRLNNHSFQLYASHTGDLAYKTQWGNDNYSGWRRILDNSNYPYAASMNQYVNTGSDPTFNSVYLANGNLRLYQGDGTALRIVTAYGYINIGSQNGSWAHIYSGQNFYFNQNLYVNGTQVVTNSGTWSISISGSAGSVAWSNVSSKPADWLNQTNLIQDYAPQDTAVPSGFYQNYNGSGNPTGTWFNYINVRHSNPSNGHGYQIGMSYYDSNLWFRSYQGGTSPTFAAWSRALGTATDPYPSNMNQYVRTSDSVTFGAATLNGQVYINRHIDANTTWGNCGCTTIFVGWGTAKVVLGNGNTGGHDWTNDRPSNSVVSTMNHYFYNNVYAREDVVAYWSDARLKTNVKPIENALEKINKIGGYFYTPNQLAVDLDATKDMSERVGVMAQEIEEVLPHVVKPAPFNENFKTVQYEKLVPLLIQGIKEQQKQIEELKEQLKNR